MQRLGSYKRCYDVLKKNQLKKTNLENKASKEEMDLIDFEDIIDVPSTSQQLTEILKPDDILWKELGCPTEANQNTNNDEPMDMDSFETSVPNSNEQSDIDKPLKRTYVSYDQKPEGQGQTYEPNYEVPKWSNTENYCISNCGRYKLPYNSNDLGRIEEIDGENDINASNMGDLKNCLSPSNSKQNEISSDNDSGFRCSIFNRIGSGFIKKTPKNRSSTRPFDNNNYFNKKKYWPRSAQRKKYDESIRAILQDELESTVTLKTVCNHCKTKNKGCHYGMEKTRKFYGGSPLHKKHYLRSKYVWINPNLILGQK